MQIYFFCYHKAGTTLVRQILETVSPLVGWRFGSVEGAASDGDPAMDAIQFEHSLIEFDLAARPHRGVRLVRDPRDVWLSGYLYHEHCREPWCVNGSFDAARPISFPKVPYSQQHRSEKWKRAYLKALGGISYQDNLKRLSLEDGLEFELVRYADWTISAMAAWKPDPHTIDVRIEDFMADFDGVLGRILRHCGVDEGEIPRAVAAASVADIRRMSDDDLRSNPHIHSRQISKWRTRLTPRQIAGFEARYADEIRQIGYSLSTDEISDPTPTTPRPGMDDLIDLLEMRVSRLERIVAAYVGEREREVKLATDRLVYTMDDPRLVLRGSYDLEGAREPKCWRWLGRSDNVQMIFPHGRGTPQRVRLLVRPFRTLDLSCSRVVVDELDIPHRLEKAESFLAWTFDLPAAFGLQTEIDIVGLPLGCPEDHGVSDSRMLSFSLHEASFTAMGALTEPEAPTEPEALTEASEPASPAK